MISANLLLHRFPVKMFHEISVASLKYKKKTLKESSGHSRRPESKMSDLLGDDLATEQFTHQQQLLVAASVARFGQVTICQFHLQHMCHPQEDWKAINTTIVPKANACRDQLDWSFGAGIVQVSSKHAPFISHIYPSLPQARREKSSCFTQSHHITFYHLQYQYYIRSKLF